MRKSVPAPALVLGGVASVQGGAAVATRLFPQAGPGGTVWLRLGLSSLLLLAIARPTLRGRSAADLRLAVAFGVALAAMNLTFYEALARIPLGVAVTIEFVGPLGLAAVMSRRRIHLLAVLGAAIGVVLVNGHELGAVDWVGVAFGLAAGLGWAAYILLSAETGRRFAQLDGLALAMVVSTLVIGPYGLATAGAELTAGHVLLVGAGVALLSSVLPYSLELLALRRMGPAFFGVLMSLEPALGALAGLLVLGQRLGIVQIIGMACVVGASITISRTRETEPIDV